MRDKYETARSVLVYSILLSLYALGIYACKETSHDYSKDVKHSIIHKFDTNKLERIVK